MNAISRRLRTSLKPALLHLALSATIALIAIAVVFLFWYPGELSIAQGVSQLVLIMIGVDVVIGPLITSVVYDPHKKWMELDLVVIAALQTAALLYGLTTIYGGRPAYVVFNVNRFDVVAIKDVDSKSLSRAQASFQPLFWAPRTVAARLPSDPVKRSDLLFSSLEGGPDLPQLPEYFVKLEEERSTMLAKLHPISELKNVNSMSDASWRRFVDTLGRNEEELGYLPLLANAKDGAVILDRRSAEIVGIRMLTPTFGKGKAKSGKPPKAGPGDAPGAKVLGAAF